MEVPKLRLEVDDLQGGIRDLQLEVGKGQVEVGDVRGEDGGGQGAKGKRVGGEWGSARVRREGKGGEERRAGERGSGEGARLGGAEARRRVGAGESDSFALTMARHEATLTDAMVTTERAKDDVTDVILDEIERDPTDVARRVVDRLGISRQAVQRRLAKLVADGIVVASGSTRARRYELTKLVDEEFTLPIASRPAEDVVWRERVKPLLGSLPENVERICQYGFTEMFNNAVDHSEGTKITVCVTRTARKVELWIIDDGVGIFFKIKRDLGLDDERHAILELSKGKLTTDPERHSGEGIFFTSMAFDEFAILSGHLSFTHLKDGSDWLLADEDEETETGTAVRMAIDVRSHRRLKEDVFDKFTEDFSFSKTIVPVRLAAYGSENLVSRSQAKRLLARFEKFREIVLDFDGVATIGQAFADEIFRVFARQHPEIHLIPVRANPEVDFFIQRALRSDV